MSGIKCRQCEQKLVILDQKHIRRVHNNGFIHVKQRGTRSHTALKYTGYTNRGRGQYDSNDSTKQ